MTPSVYPARLASSSESYSTLPSDDQGRISLNALHRAYEESTGTPAPHKAPAKWARCGPAKRLIDAAGEGSISKIYGTDKPGTHATKPVALAYSLWLGGADFLMYIASKIDDMGAVVDALRNFEVPDELDDMFVYAIRERDTGNVKIGISKSPSQRLRQLQIGNSHPLEIVATFLAPHRFKDEADAHSILEDHRLYGEWFSPAVVQDEAFAERFLHQEKTPSRC